MKHLLLVLIAGMLYGCCDCPKLSPMPEGVEITNPMDTGKALELHPVKTNQSSVSVEKPRLSPQDTSGVYFDKEGNSYIIHTGAKGGRYIERTSKKTGKVYKQYLK